MHDFYAEMTEDEQIQYAELALQREKDMKECDKVGGEVHGSPAGARSERPILFSGPMVRAILEGKKTQTRRILKGSTEFKGPYNPAYLEMHKRDKGWANICPYGKPGDQLWVRETFVTFNTRTPDEQAKMRAAALRFERNEVTDILAECEAFPTSTGPLKALYKADFGAWADDPDCDLGPWTPSIHMPRWASRLTLEITEVRVQRLQDISPDDAFAEGCGGGLYFNALWDSINGKREGASWECNPWVWVLTFRIAAHVEPIPEAATSIPTQNSPTGENP